MSDKRFKSPLYSIPGHRVARPELAGKKEEPELPKKKLDKEIEHSLELELERTLRSDQQLKRIFFIRNIIVIIGIIILIFSIIISINNYIIFINQPDTLEKTGYRLLKDVQGSEELEADIDVGTYTWDAERFLGSTSDDIIMSSNANDLGFKLLIEVHDLSYYSLKYNRTLENNLAWSNLDISTLSGSAPENSFSISGLINIYVSPSEIHLAKVTVTVWK